MKMKHIAACGFLLNTIFFATYYSVTKEALNRIDPIVFTFFEMVSLVPFGLIILFCTRKHLTRAIIQRGILLGSTLCLALFTIAIALKYTTATSTAFFPALNGFLAAIIAWAVFREPTRPQTWVAGLISLSGAALLIFSSSLGNLRGTLIAFLGGLFYTAYIFLCDHEQKDESEAWPLFGVELLSTALWACLVVLLFGDWQAVHPELPKDIWVILYVSLACTFVPTLISVILQKYISPVTVSFIYVLEPILGALIAYLYLHETLTAPGYIGGAMVVVGALVNAWGTIGRSAARRVVVPASARESGTWVSAILYPGLCALVGAGLLYYLSGFPPASWRELLQVWPQMTAQGGTVQGIDVTLLLVQAAGWLIAWISVVVLGWLALYHLLQRLFQPKRASQYPRSIVQAHRPPQPSVVPSQPVHRPVLQPERRFKTTARLSEQTQFELPTVPGPMRQYPPVQPTVPGPARQMPAPDGPPSWYGEAVHNGYSGPGISTGRGRDLASTDPLPPDPGFPLKRRASLAQQPIVRTTPSLESLDA
jgi:drug/metabolite transporter (DMT)-like permease